MRRKYNDLLAKRAGMLAEAETLLKDGKRDYKFKTAETATSTTRSRRSRPSSTSRDRQFLERKDASRRGEGQGR